MGAKPKPKKYDDGIVRFPRHGHAKLSKSLVGVLQDINKRFSQKLDGQKACVFSGSIFHDKRGYVPTGILPLDMAISGGEGWPQGTVEIFGQEASGKSALLEQTLAEAQRLNYVTAMFQIECTLHARRAQVVGLNPERLIMLPGRTVEDIFEITRNFIRGVRDEDPDTPIVIGWDSVAATKTRSQLDLKHALGDGFAEQARRLSEFFQILADELFAYKATLILVNQMRANIGSRFGGKKAAGGNTIPYYAWVRCQIYVKERIKNSAGTVVGVMVEATLIKNKWHPPFQSVRFPIYWDRGVDVQMALWEYMRDIDLIKKVGRTGYEFESRPITPRSFPVVWAANKEKITALIRKQES